MSRQAQINPLQTTAALALCRRQRRRAYQISKKSTGHGRQQEVRGEGVVGEQPVITPGDTFEYTSGTPLGTPSGIMVGSYEMVTSDGESFDAMVPAFSLDSPYAQKQLN